jgi:hypothetical protein
MTEPEMHVTLICDEEPHAAELFAIGDRPLDVVRAVRRLTRWRPWPNSSRPVRWQRCAPG